MSSSSLSFWWGVFICHGVALESVCGAAGRSDFFGADFGRKPLENQADSFQPLSEGTNAHVGGWVSIFGTTLNGPYTDLASTLNRLYIDLELTLNQP